MNIILSQTDIVDRSALIRESDINVFAQAVESLLGWLPETWTQTEHIPNKVEIPELPFYTMKLCFPM